MVDRKTGSCHCGSVKFEVTLRDGLKNARRCNCSLCRRKGAIMADIEESDIKILKGEDNLVLYQWNTNIAKHWFCRSCGIYTHHQKRSEPPGYGFNVACLEDFDPFTLGDIPVANGARLSLIGDDKS